MYSDPGASDRLVAALQGSTAAQIYDPSQALTYIWNEARYPPFPDEVSRANFEKLAPAARLECSMSNGSPILQSSNSDDSLVLQTIFDQIGISNINIMSTM